MWLLNNSLKCHLIYCLISSIVLACVWIDLTYVLPDNLMVRAVLLQDDLTKNDSGKFHPPRNCLLFCSSTQMFRTTHHKLGVRTNRGKGMTMNYSENMSEKQRSGKTRRSHTANKLSASFMLFSFFGVDWLMNSHVKCKFCPRLLTVMLFQTCMTFFLLWKTKEDKRE